MSGKGRRVVVRFKVTIMCRPFTGVVTLAVNGQGMGRAAARRDAQRQVRGVLHRFKVIYRLDEVCGG